MSSIYVQIPPCNIFLSNTLSHTWSLNMRYKSQTHTKAVTYYSNTYYRRTVALKKERIFISLDVWMGSACRRCSIVARSDVDNRYFVLYVPTVGYCLCYDISAGLIRQTDLYATYYMGLCNMRVSTALIPLF